MTPILAVVSKCVYCVRPWTEFCMKAGTLILPVSACCAIKIRRKHTAFYRFKMTMLGILGQVKPFVLFKKCLIDNATFRLHYKVHIYYIGEGFLFLTILEFSLFSICFFLLYLSFPFAPSFPSSCSAWHRCSQRWRKTLELPSTALLTRMCLRASLRCYSWNRSFSSFFGNISFSSYSSWYVLHFRPTVGFMAPSLCPRR